VQRAYKARCNPATRLLTIPTTPTIRRTTPMGRTLRGAIIQTNPTFRRSLKIPMIVKRRQRVRRAVPTIRIPQADRTTPIPRAAQHPPRHQGRAVLAEQVERAAELNRKAWATFRYSRFSGLGLRGRCYRRPHWIHFLAVGTFCFNSSNQFSTTLICVGGCPGSTGCIARNR
jgi:hypothetical protein